MSITSLFSSHQRNVLFCQINGFCVTAAKWAVSVSVSERDARRLAHIVQDSQAHKERTAAPRSFALAPPRGAFLIQQP